MVGFSRKQEMDRLTKDQPKFDDVLDAIGKLQNGSGSTNEEQLVWLYYFPLCLQTAWHYIKDDEDAREMALDLFEHWQKVVLVYDGNKASLWALYKEASKNYFLNYKRDVLDKRPDIIYSGQTDDDETDTEDGMNGNAAFSDVFDYPYDGTNNAPEIKLMEQEQVEEVRAGLYPADKEVFDLLVEGYTSIEVAEALGRTEKGVSMSIERIRECARE